MKNSSAQKETVSAANRSERVNLNFKVIQQEFKNDLLKRSARDNKKSFIKAIPRWISILEWHE